MAPAACRGHESLNEEVGMDRTQHPHGAVLTIAIVGALILGASSLDAGDSKSITLTLAIDGSGTATISVDPENAMIWRNRPDKPKKVEWRTVNDTAHAELYWELRFDPDKGGGSADYFGDVDIACRESAKKVQPDKKPDFPFAQWPYSVTVFTCVDGVKGERLVTADPRIVWKD
jgi:hypothetical protein